MEENKTRFLLLSLKWTHKKDKWITFWRKNASGYCWFKEWAGDKLKGLWIKVNYEGYEREVLPNTLKIRKILGVTLDNFKASNPSF